MARPSIRKTIDMNAWQPFEWVVALRFLQEGFVQTLFILSGIAVGVAVIVFMSALLTGMQANFVNRVLTGQSHIQLLAHKETVTPVSPASKEGRSMYVIQVPLQRFKGIDQWQPLASQLSKNTEIRVVSPSVSGSALAMRGEVSRAVTVTGVLPEQFFKVIPLPDKIIQGHANINSESILIGSELAIDLGLNVGDKLWLSAANGRRLMLTVTGIFDLGNKGANSRMTYVAFRNAQNLFDLTGGATVLDIVMNDVYQAELMARKIASETGLQADSWITTNEQFFTAVKAQTTANTAIRFFVALSVGFGIASVLVVSVVQRSREIGILRAMGITRGQVLRIFLLQGGLLGLGGSLIGAGIGALALYLWQHYMRNVDGTVMFALQFDTELLIQTLVLATITGLLSAFAPALRAARLDPVVAIRG
jgi:lipoprotein-releasing system permease protein